ncbi:MAG: hypothetical protein JW716_01855 [Candidatus Aenigmarchaeota archaeon]|nr:hypothetical protein [Candidatus Aenigmarchaeota archaeon]
MLFSGLFGHRRKIRKLRKKWDREREKALKLKEPLRTNVLKKMDQIELNIRSLEEQRLGRVDVARLTKETEIDLEETKAIMKSKELYNQPQSN